MLDVVVSNVLACLVPLARFQELEDDLLDHLFVGVQLRVGTCEQCFRIIRHDDGFLSVDSRRDDAGKCKRRSDDNVSQSILLDELSI